MIDLNLPNDDTGNVLRKMYARGNDLTKVRNIDFYAVFNSWKKVVEFLDLHGETAHSVTSTTVCRTIVAKEWEVTFVYTIVPNYRSIVTIENMLERIAKEAGGKYDGWGCMSLTASSRLEQAGDA